MAEYRLYHFKLGHIDKVQTFSASGEPEAIEEGRRLAGDVLAELWRDGQKIRIFNPDQ